MDASKTSAGILDVSLIKRGAKHVAKGSLLFLLSMVTAFPARLLLFFTVIAYLLIGGLGLVILRWAFFKALPTLIRFAGPLTVLVEFFASIIVLFIDAAITVVDAIIKLEKFFGAKPTNNMVKFVGFKLFTVSEVKNELIFILNTCQPYDNAYTVISHSIKRAAHKPVCALVRYTYPSSWVYTMASGSLSWLYFGSAEPDNTHAALPDMNCELPPGQEGQYIPAVCAALGAGYVILEIVLPIFLIVLWHSACGVAFWLMVWGILQIGYAGVESAERLVYALFLKYLL